MTDLAGREEVEILADKDPGVGLPGRVYLPGYSRTMGPQSHLFAERERLQSLTWEHFDVKQLSPTPLEQNLSVLTFLKNSQMK